MSVLIKKARIIQSNGKYHLKKMDVFVDKGIIQKIGKSLNVKAAKVIEGKDLCLSPGWVDIGTHCGEPGFEHRETIKSLKDAASKGGYTHLAVFPNTNPVLDNSTSLRYYTNQNVSAVKLMPIGALSQGIKGTDITEYCDMNEAGAVAFSDGLKSVDNNGLLMRSLQYAKRFDGLIIHHPNDHQICSNGQIHEGVVSTSLGLTGIPSMAELSHVERDISLLAYTESRLLIHLISSKESLDAIKQAKKKNAALFSSVAYMNLIHNEEDLLSFDSQYKVTPPLRSKKDQSALLKAVKNGEIDIIASNHFPLEDDLKNDAFQYTKTGTIGLQTSFAATMNAIGDEPEIIEKCFSANPRKILGMQEVKIEELQAADLTIFDLKKEWTFMSEDNLSLSNNTPYIGKTFGAKVLGTILGKQTSL